jgi:hypothetical protein
VIDETADLLSEPSDPADLVPHLPAPDLIEPLVAFRSWRAVDGRLRSPYLPVFWEQPVARASCDLGSGRGGHAAPAPGCTCGIYAYMKPDLEFPAVDYRGISGIVTLWGNIEVHAAGMRAEHAKVEALGLYSRWSRRHKRAVWAIADRLGVDLVDLDDLDRSADRYGRRLPVDLLPGRLRKRGRPLAVRLRTRLGSRAA